MNETQNRIVENVLTHLERLIDTHADLHWLTYNVVSYMAYRNAQKLCLEHANEELKTAVYTGFEIAMSEGVQS